MVYPPPFSGKSVGGKPFFPFSVRTCVHSLCTCARRVVWLYRSCGQRKRARAQRARARMCTENAHAFLRAYARAYMHMYVHLYIYVRTYICVDRWFTSGLQVVYNWSTSGLQVVYRWSTTDLQVVYKWSTSGLQVVYKPCGRADKLKTNDVDNFTSSRLLKLKTSQIEDFAY